VSALVLLHGDGMRPSLRELLGTLLVRAERADIAIAHLRLLALDLTDAELGELCRCRLLLGRLDAAALDDLHVGPHDPTGRARLDRLRRLLDSGRVAIRSGGAMRWTPDFSLFHGLPISRACPAGTVCVIGAHYFTRPLAGPGAAFTALLAAPRAVRIAASRFEQLWACAHDVAEAVRVVTM
jgi:hypothetical protein